MTDQPRSAEIIGRRRLVLAAAGSGKTYRLSSRFIALLAEGASPEEILATTFTRKAAGEIIERVLLRLAAATSGPTHAATLAESIGASVSADSPAQRGFADLLLRTVRELDRLQILTLDAFFYRIVRAFSLDLGLPPNWMLAQEPDRRRIHRRALQATLREMDPEVLATVIRDIGRGGADRPVHELLSAATAHLYEIFRALDPAAEDPWGDPAGDGEGPDEDRVEELIDGVEKAALPETKARLPDEAWAKARDQGVEAIRRRDWQRFLTVGLAKAIVAGGGSYRSKQVPGNLLEAYEPLIQIAAAALRARSNRRVRALGRLLPEFDRRLSRIRREEGLYGFEDLTHLLRAVHGEASEVEVSYRLGGKIRHLLLDEFQDTSNAQWDALEPLSRKMLTPEDTERVFYVVADPKQSIYGWRGGEPRILDDLQARYGLTPESMSTSRRSSQVILDLVNRVFGRIAKLELLEEDGAAVEGWARGFEEHEAVHSRPGYAHIEVGPAESGSGSQMFRPQLLTHAASRVAELHRELPGASIGVLTRTNRSAAYLFAQLRRAGLDASEEGGVPVVDSAPVLALLALLRWMDHPADSVSRYLVRTTPVASLLGLSKGGWRDENAQADAIRHLRQRLLSEGYGRVVSGWVKELLGSVPQRDRRRLRQLAEQAHRWDETATARPSDFVSLVEAARAEDPASTAVRVMTIHGAKGLEFDVVVLPDLDSLRLVSDQGSPFLALRTGGTGPVQRVLPRVKREILPLFPELVAASSQDREAQLRDGLSLLYVAMTRARHALYAYLSPSKRRDTRAPSAACVLRHALRLGLDTQTGSVLYKDGSTGWWEELTEGAPLPAGPDIRRQPWKKVEKVASRAQPAGTLRLVPSRGRRMVPHRTPSQLGEGSSRDLEMLLRGKGRLRRRQGTALHLWLSSIEWLESGLPDDDELHEVAVVAVPHEPDRRELLEHFKEALIQPEIRRFLSRASWPEGTRVERELPFLARDGDVVIEGKADRVLHLPAAPRRSLVVVDWKSEALRQDDTAGVEAAVERHRPQLEAYVRGLASVEGLGLDQVEGFLAFTSVGIARAVPTRPTSSV